MSLNVPFTYPASKIEKVIKYDLVSKNDINQLNKEYFMDDSIYEEFAQKFQQEIIWQFYAPKGYFSDTNCSYAKETKILVSNSITNLQKFIYEKYGRCEYRVEYNQSRHGKVVTIIHNDNIELDKDADAAIKEYQEQIEKKAKFIVINKMEVLIPFKENRDLILLLSTNQKVKGWFDYDRKKFSAFPVSDDSTKFSIQNLDIHNFVTRWEIDKEPDKKYNFKNWIQKASNGFYFNHQKLTEKCYNKFLNSINNTPVFGEIFS